MNDRKKYEALLAPLEAFAKEQEESINLADRLVWNNKNQKDASGGGDGSIFGATWTAARDAVGALKIFQINMEQLKYEQRDASPTRTVPGATVF